MECNLQVIIYTLFYLLSEHMLTFVNIGFYLFDYTRPYVLAQLHSLTKETSY